MTGRANVLVVDDDEAIRDVVAEVLRDEGYSVVCAENGAQALREIQGDHHPDLVLLDLMMPVMSGWEVLEQLQASEELSQIPVVVVSAMTAPGVREHLAKPIDLDNLLETVGRLTR
jgi:CheY-like chemotaxis protein